MAVKIINAPTIEGVNMFIIHKLNVDKNPTDYKAWFLHKNRLMKEQKIFFGHWSTLKGVDVNNIFALDHGCVWGERLTAYNLSNKTFTSQKSLERS